jgi:moderate conductance mechanosensitive channel
MTVEEFFAYAPVRVFCIVIIAAVLTIVTTWLVKRLTRNVVALPTRLAGSDRSRSEARQQALGTVLRSTAIGLIWATAVITIVGEAGVNIGGFVATATIIGGALAFGAQTLVRDAIAGFFVLAEDQYGVGDVVDVGHATGVVERITLRSVRLRDAEGRIWHVPHGGVLRTANLSKSPKVLLDLEVTRASHLDELDAAAANLCRDLATDISVSAMFSGSPESLGIIEVRDDRLIYRLSVDTKPGQADSVKRTWRLLALRAFERGDFVAPPLVLPLPQQATPFATIPQPPLLPIPKAT